jgi:hypothetical protein
MFGRRKTPFRPEPGIPQPPVDSDGKRRVFGEAIFAGEHGDMLRRLGFGLDDPANIIPDAAEIDRRVKASLTRQEERRREIEAELLRQHGHNAIRPFFVLAEPVFNGALGSWLMASMKLLPYDDWNLVYLPMDRETQAAMGDLPLHPRQSIEPIDKLMCDQIGDFHKQYLDAKAKADAHVAALGISQAREVIDRFVTYSDAMPRRIIDHVDKVRPMIVALIADVQSKASGAIH